MQSGAAPADADMPARSAAYRMIGGGAGGLFVCADFPRQAYGKNFRIKKFRCAERNFCFYLLENCGARRAFLRPYFFLSLTRGSRVRKPAFLSAGRVSGSD